jgi:hypothetical protein
MTIRRVVKPLPLCARHRTQLGRGQLDLSTLVEPDPYLLAEDGVLDAWASLIAAKGYRQSPVKLTERERMLAVAMIIEQDPDDLSELIMARLGVSRATAWSLAQKVGEAGIDLGGVEF